MIYDEKVKGKTVEKIIERECEGFGSECYMKMVIIQFTDGSELTIEFEDAYYMLSIGFKEAGE